MPIYEYECPKCGLFEAMQNVSEKPLKCKPDCEEKNCPKNAKRLISAAAFHLKGTGWYKTDYASGKSTGSTSGSTSSDKSSGSDSSDKKEPAKKEKSSLKQAKGGGGGSGGCGSGCGCH